MAPVAFSQQPRGIRLTLSASGLVGVVIRLVRDCVIGQTDRVVEVLAS
jgi:hypothetical protein